MKTQKAVTKLAEISDLTIETIEALSQEMSILRQVQESMMDIIADLIKAGTQNDERMNDIIPLTLVTLEGLIVQTVNPNSETKDHLLALGRMISERISSEK